MRPERLSNQPKVVLQKWQTRLVEYSKSQSSFPTGKKDAGLGCEHPGDLPSFPLMRLGTDLLFPGWARGGGEGGSFRLAERLTHSSFLLRPGENLVPEPSLQVQKALQEWGGAA